MDAKKGSVSKEEVQKEVEILASREDPSKTYREHHECLEEDVEQAIEYKTCLIEHLQKKFAEDLPEFAVISDRKKEMCHKLATLMVSHKCCHSLCLVANTHRTSYLVEFVH